MKNLESDNTVKLINTYSDEKNLNFFLVMKFEPNGNL